ncbi:Germinal-center associated nuclear protein [Halotydeus destructor]|nr:Germinal-center associated nuclear protein [Halotydeus destructor]
MMQTTALSEKIQVLKDRDKRLRDSRERQTDIKTATAVTGTCPDMCPELERYFREDVKQLSTFEQFSGDVPNSHAMVKEYRRAAADEPDPLAHELRPGPILARTMDYLVCNVLDRLEEPGLSGEWYDFLWNRTRAIRKDITQQHICDETSVDLLEKCVRFHIHAAAVLCEEDLSVYDPKINDENLNKCVKSLTDFYYDLSLKGLTCANEAEIRGYNILLNLKNTDILMEIKYFRRDIRDSAQVKFAVKAYFALSQNNFVKFFSLVKSTTYLNACIMHRYFDDIRVKGMNVLRTVYKRVGKKEQVPKEFYSTEEFRQLFMFDNYDQVKTFCEAFEIQVDEQWVTLTREHRNGMQVTSLNSKMRSRNLVENKRTISIGEVVNNGPLPENPYNKFPLHNSFDARGRLKNAAVNADDQKLKSEFVLQEQGLLEVGDYEDNYDELETLTRAPTRRVLDEKDIQDIIFPIAESMLQATVNLVLKDVAKSVYMESVKTHLVQHFSHHTLLSTVDSLTVSLCTDILVIEKKLSDENRARWRLTVSRVANQIAEQVLAQEVASQVFNTSKEVRKIELREYIAVNSKKTAILLVEKEVEHLVRGACNTAFVEACRDRDDIVLKMIKKRRWRLARDCLDIWLAKYRRSKRRKRVKDTFPASVMQTPKPRSGIEKISPRPVPRSSLPLPKAKSETKRKLNETIESPARITPPPAKRLANTVQFPLGTKKHIRRVEHLTGNKPQSLPRSSSAFDLLTELQNRIEEEKRKARKFNESVDVIASTFAEIDKLNGK